MFERKTIVVTGAHGFLGRHIARQLAKETHTVWGVGNGNWRPGECQSWGFSHWHSGAVTAESLRLLGGKPDLIFHCAGGGSVAVSMERPQYDFERSVCSTSEVLEYMRLHAPDARLVYPSSAAVYGAASQGPIAESAATAPVSPYGVHKSMAEELCRLYGRIFGLKIAIVRLFSLYGQELKKQLLWDTCHKLQNADATFPGCGGETRDWLHVEDAVNLLMTVATSASQDVPVFNGGSGRAVAVKTVVDLLRVLQNSNSSVCFDGTRREGDPRHLVADIAEAKKTGWGPRISLEDGLRDYVDWFRGSV